MQEWVKLIIGIFVLILGVPIGNLLKRYTQDEQRIGQPWFKILVYIGLFGGLIGLIIKKDWVMFTFFFIAIVSSKSLIR